MHTAFPRFWSPTSLLPRSSARLEELTAELRRTLQAGSVTPATVHVEGT